MDGAGSRGGRVSDSRSWGRAWVSLTWAGEGRDTRGASRSHPSSPPLSFPGTHRHPHPLAAQIFNLMKFDSYARFVKSPLYQECLLAEAEGRPLREPGSSCLGSPDTSRKVRTGVAGGRAGTADSLRKGLPQL